MRTQIDYEHLGHRRIRQQYAGKPYKALAAILGAAVAIAGAAIGLAAWAVQHFAK